MTKKKEKTPAKRSAASVGRGEARGGGRIKVQATALGYYNDQRKRVGDVFTISSERQPDKYPLRDTDGKAHPNAGKANPHAGELKELGKWMEIVDSNVPERTTTSQQALNRETHRVAQEKAGRHVPEDNGGGSGTDVLGN